MPAIEISPGAYWIGVNDRTTDLFEGVWPITSEGVSYNSYAIIDEKKALIDLTKAFKGEDFIAMISQLFDPSTLDYIIVNHSEPDHTGALPAIRKLAPRARILCTPKAADMLRDFYGISDDVHTVADGEQVSLGRHTLTFHHTPFLHWPDTMMTYDEADGTLYSCDAFGSYGALPGNIFDDGCGDLEGYTRMALRYYANIISKYSPLVKRALDKLAGLGKPIRMIAPAHGLVWRRDPSALLQLYARWAAWHGGAAEPGVTLLFGSMYGNTEKYMNAFAQGIDSAGLPVEIFDVSKIHSAYILPAIMRYRAIALNVPTYEAGLFPPAAHVLDMIERKNIRHRHAAIFGSYLWSGGAQPEFKKVVEKLQWTLADSGEFRGSGRKDTETGFDLGRKFALSVKDLPPPAPQAPRAKE